MELIKQVTVATSLDNQLLNFTDRFDGSNELISKHVANFLVENRLERAMKIFRKSCIMC